MTFAVHHKFKNLFQKFPHIFFKEDLCKRDFSFFPVFEQLPGLACVRILEITESGEWIFQMARWETGVLSWEDQIVVPYKQFTLEKGVLSTLEKKVYGATSLPSNTIHKLLKAGFYKRPNSEHTYSRNEINVILPSSFTSEYGLGFNREWVTFSSPEELLAVLDGKIAEWIKVPFDGVTRENLRLTTEELDKLLKEAISEIS